MSEPVENTSADSAAAADQLNPEQTGSLPVGTAVYDVAHAGGGVATRLRGVHAPYLDQYFGVWCVEEHRFRAAVERINQMDLRLHLQRQEEIRAAGGGRAGRKYNYEITSDGTAIIDVAGTLMKQESSMDESTSSVMLRGSIRDARSNDAVKRIALVIDSPGGTAAGTQDLADDVAALAAEKPVLAYIEDLGASAAYWVASQAGAIATNRTGIIGSIGTYATVYDSSARAAMMGIKVHIIRGRPGTSLKGAGAPGTQITQEQLDKWQATVDALNAQFLDAVSRGRRMSMDRVEKVADGNVHVGAAALSLGLVDHVESFDASLKRLQTMQPKRRATASVGFTLSDETKMSIDSILKAAAVIRAVSETNPITAKESSGADSGDDASSGSAGDSAAATHEEDQPMADPKIPAAAGTTPAVAPAVSTPAAAAVGTQPVAGTPAGSIPAASSPDNGPKPATIGELKAAFAGAENAMFVIEAAELGWTMAEAQAAHKVVQSQVAGRTTQPAAASTTRRPGVKPIESAAARSSGAAADVGGDGSATAEFDAKVKALVDKGTARQVASQRVLSTDPDLRERYNDEQNAAAAERRAQMMREKLERVA